MPSKFDNLQDTSEYEIYLKDGPHKGRYITRGHVRRWYSLEIMNKPGHYAYYHFLSDETVKRGRKKDCIFIYSMDQIDGPDTSLANTMEERKLRGEKYDLRKI